MNQIPLTPIPTPNPNLRPIAKPAIWRRYWFWLMLGFGMFVVLLAVANWPRPLVISPETTVLTEPLTPDGRRVDYFAWLEAQYPPEMKTDENAARILTRKLGPGSGCLPTEKMSDQEKAAQNSAADRYYERLGLDRAVDTPSLAYTEFPQAVKEWLTKEIVEKKSISVEQQIEFLLTIGRTQNFYPRDYLEAMSDEDRIQLFTEQKTKHLESLNSRELIREYEPMVRAWVTENSAALDAMVEASQAKVCRPPMVYSDAEPPALFEMQLPGIRMLRQCARELLLRATLRVQDGDIDGALSDRAAAYRLGVLLKSDSLFTPETLTALAMMGSAFMMPLGANPDTLPTAEQWRTLRQNEEALPDRFDLARNRQCERFVGLDAICRLAVGDSLLSDSPGSTPGFLVDWSRVLRNVNYFFDHPNEAERLIGQAWDSKPPWDFVTLLTTNGRTEKVVILMLSLFQPSRDAFDKALLRHDCLKNLRRISYAMQLYRAEHGTFPPAFSTDADGKPLHSWRVLLLPYFEEEKLTALAEKIKLDEPWDSPANQAFHDQMPEVYRCPAQQVSEAFPKQTNGDSSDTAPTANANQTNYTVLVGPNTLFSETGGAGRDPLALRKENPDRDTLGMTLVTERQTEIDWMTPDAELTEAEALLGIDPTVEGGENALGANGRSLVSKHPGGVLRVAADGSVAFLSGATEEKEFIPSVTGHKPE